VSESVAEGRRLRRIGAKRACRVSIAMACKTGTDSG
jgi:hypothetical protein